MKLSVTFILLVALLGCSAGPQGRIAGGDDAVLGQLPYQAALSIGGIYNCGAVIIAEYYALTSLTCVCSAGSDIAWPPQLFSVSAGTVDLYSGGQRIRVEEITVNPNYNQLAIGLALLRLSEPFIFNEFVSALPLATADPPLDAQVEISGWGRTKATDTTMYRTLQIGESVVVVERECRQIDDETTNEQMLCLGQGRRQGICIGDLGGPAVYQGTLVGLAAQLLGECGSMLPERYVSIAANYEWIKYQME